MSYCRSTRRGHCIAIEICPRCPGAERERQRAIKDGFDVRIRPCPEHYARALARLVPDPDLQSTQKA